SRAVQSALLLRQRAGQTGGQRDLRGWSGRRRWGERGAGAPCSEPTGGSRPPLAPVSHRLPFLPPPRFLFPHWLGGGSPRVRDDAVAPGAGTDRPPPPTVARIVAG